MSDIIRVFMFVVFLFILGMLGVALAAGSISSFADQPSSWPKIVLHVKAESCKEAQSVFPVLSAGRDGLFNTSTERFGFAAVSCDESDGSAHSVYVTERGVHDGFHMLQLFLDHQDPDLTAVVARSHVLRVDFEHEWIGTLELSDGGLSHLPPQASPALAERLSNRQGCPTSNQFQTIAHDCGVEWRHADLATFEVIE